MFSFYFIKYATIYHIRRFRQVIDCETYISMSIISVLYDRPFLTNFGKLCLNFCARFVIIFSYESDWILPNTFQCNLPHFKCICYRGQESAHMSTWPPDFTHTLCTSCKASIKMLLLLYVTSCTLSSAVCIFWNCELENNLSWAETCHSFKHINALV